MLEGMKSVPLTSFEQSCRQSVMFSEVTAPVSSSSSSGTCEVIVLEGDCLQVRIAHSSVCSWLICLLGGSMVGY